MDEFARLQAALPAALAVNVPKSGIDHVVVAMASYSVSGSLLEHYGARFPAMEHRYLNASLLLSRIDCDFVFVSSVAPGADVLAYYRSLVAPEVAQRMRRRVHCFAVDDSSARSLAQKVLDRPDVVAGIRDVVRGRVAVLEPWNVTAHEVAVALALGVPVNGTDPALRGEAFKSAGRRLFHRTGVPVPLGREDVRTVDDVAASAEWILAARPGVARAVIKHDDSGAGDGNRVLQLLDPTGMRRDPHEILTDVTALPDWFRDDLRTGGGVVEEMVAGEELRSPSVQFDLLPGGGVRILATHDQVLGGDNGQVYLGCRFPADRAYAAELARYGAAVGHDLAARGCVGRAGIDFMAARSRGGPWSITALEVNLRKGGTTHPFSALRNLVAGHYDTLAGQWVADADGGTRAYRSSDNVVDPAWTGRSPSSVIEAVCAAGLNFDHQRGTGVVLHMVSGLAVDGRFGATAIGRTPEHADHLFEAMLTAVAA